MICMCVVNKQFELLEFVFDSVYVDLQYDEISLIFYCWVCQSGMALRMHTSINQPFNDELLDRQNYMDFLISNL